MSTAPGDNRALGIEHPLVIAHVLAPAPFGGLERVVRALALGHAKRAHRVHVIQVFEEHEPFLPITFGESSSIVPHMVRVKRRRYWRERAEVRSICRGQGVQVVHTHGYRPDVIDSGIAASVGAARVTTVHGFTGGGLKNRVFEKLQIAAFRRFDAVIVVSAPLVQSLTRRGVPPDRVHLIPNAWSPPPTPPMSRQDARAALGLPAHGVVVGWVGRLSSEKAPDVLLDALALIPESPFTAAFLGNGPTLPSLRQRALEAGISDKIRWCGAIDEASRFFRAFDVFALSSRTEGTPIVLFEAMAAGIPIVATRVGGVPDVLSEDQARLVPSDDPLALANALLAVISDAPETARRRAAGAMRLASYDAAGWLDRYEQIYRRAIGERAMSARVDPHSRSG